MKEFCLWIEDVYSVWETACGNMFEFSVGSPKENKVRFCMYCGKKLHQRKFK